jgi:hypothetical protein
MNHNRLFNDPQADILTEIRTELARAKKVHPRWPVHLVGQSGIVMEEAGELIRECVNLKYGGKKDKEARVKAKAEIRKEAIQLCATALRFLENLK